MKPPESTPESILAAACAIGTGERRGTYGEPEDSLQSIADFWQAYIQARSAKRQPGEVLILGPQDVANMMILLKLARSLGPGAHRDNYVDIAGYAALAGGRGGGSL